MKTNSFPPVILLFLLLIGISCGDKESKIVPTFLDIEEFVVDKNVKAEFEHNYADPINGNRIIVTLPAGYPFDYVIPTIRANKHAVEISPASGKGVIFEALGPITYTLVGKNSRKTIYELYVRRNELPKLTTSLPDYQLKQVEGQQVSFRIPNAGSIDARMTYEVLFFDEKRTQIYSFLGKGYHSNITVQLPKFFKSGKYQAKILVKDKTQLNAAPKETELIPINFIKSENSIIVSPGAQLPKGQVYTLRGYGFVNDKQYKLRLKNDFMPSAIEIKGHYIDETQIDFSIPSNLEDVDYQGIFLENEIEKTVSLENNTMFLTKEESRPSLISLFDIKDGSPSSIANPVYRKGESINTYLFLRNTGNPYNLVLTNLNTAEEFNLIGKGRYLEARYTSYLSFTIPFNIPTGFYSVQGLADGQKTTRYWKKIEIK